MLILRWQLERTARYEDGFNKDHPVIKNFWSVLHSLQLDQQKKVRRVFLFQFCLAFACFVLIAPWQRVNWLAESLLFTPSLSCL